MLEGELPIPSSEFLVAFVTWRLGFVEPWDKETVKPKLLVSEGRVKTPNMFFCHCPGLETEMHLRELSLNIYTNGKLFPQSISLMTTQNFYFDDNGH